MSATKDDRDEEKGDAPEEENESDLLYGLEETPPWYLLLWLSFQQFMMTVTSTIPNPILIAGPLCLADDGVGLGEILGTAFFVGGVSSLVQTTFGIRLPIVQGPSSSFIAPIIMLMKINAAKCPNFNNPGNTTLPFEAGSDEHRSIWKSNMNELQGALMVASLMEVFLGFSGLIGVLMRYIGPLTTGTAITLIGLSLSPAAAGKGSTQWWICFATIFLVALFSQYLRNITMPFFGRRIKIFLLFPVLLAMCIGWLICLILTATDALPDKRGEWGYQARTDIRLEAIRNAEWFRFPYPGQWGVPTLTAGGVAAMMAAILSSTIESVGDYYACARLCGVSRPPGNAISRGIGMEGLCCILAGACGTGGGFTSFSNLIASIGLTKVASRVVVQLAAVMLIVVGCVGKVGAFFSTIPDPILGAMLIAMMGLVTAVGIANIGMVDLKSTRNLFVFGVSLFFALTVPGWVKNNPFDLGNETADRVLTILCSTSMLVGGVLAFIMDNTMPGTLKERGIILLEEENDTNTQSDVSPYDLPLIQPCINKIKCCSLIPFCPRYIKDEKKHTDDSSVHPEMDEDKHEGINNAGFESEK